MRRLRRSVFTTVTLLLLVLTSGLALGQIERTKKTAKHEIGSSTTSKTPKIITLRLAQFQTSSSAKAKLKKDENPTNFANLERSTLPPANTLFVGYLHDTNGTYDNGNIDYEWRNEFYRAALRFHSTKLLHHSIIKATLNLRIFKTHVRGVHSANDHYTQTSACTKTAQSGKAEWWTNTGLPVEAGAPLVLVQPSGTSNLHIDVTDIVSQWTEPHSNFGLVLVGENEDLGAYTETICQAQFVHAGQGAPTLKVEYK